MAEKMRTKLQICMSKKCMKKGTLDSQRVAEVGLCVNLSLPHLGASLDRVVSNPMSNDKFGGVEIKTNPKAGSMGLSIAQTVGHPSFTANHFFLVSKDGQIILNTDHSYYY